MSSKTKRGGPVATGAASLAVVTGGASERGGVTVASPAPQSVAVTAPAAVGRVTAPGIMSRISGTSGRPGGVATLTARPKPFTTDVAESPQIRLDLDLWQGTPSNVAWSGDMVSNGRWCFSASILNGSDKVEVLAHRSFVKLHKRAVEAMDDGGKGPPELVTADRNNVIRQAMLDMLTPAPVGVPVVRTDLVLHNPDLAETHNLKSEFFRVYVRANVPGMQDVPGPAVVLFPDGYIQNLGDPVQLWPAVRAKCWTDGGWAGLFESPPKLAAAITDLVHAVASVVPDPGEPAGTETVTPA